MQSLSRYSRSNQINKEWLDEYLNEAHTNGLQSVRCHCNIIAWAENGNELRRVKNDVGSALALMECTPRHNTTDLPAFTGRAYRETKRTSLRKRRFTRSPNRRYVSLRLKPATGTRSLPSAAHGGQADGKARLPRHIRFAHEKRGGDQPEQVHTWPQRQRKELSSPTIL